MYAMLGTRPDIAHAVGVLGCHSANPGPLHWAAVVHVLRYLKGTLDYGLEFNPDNSPLTGFKAYSDSDWGACPTTSRSTMGYTFILANGAVAWSSKLQPRVTGSSSEAEYIGLSHASKEAVFLSQLLSELGYPLPHPTTLFGDNQGANALSRDPQFHYRTRHLCLNEHFVQEQVQQGFINVTYIPTSQMVADIMTKSLPAPSFSTHRLSLGVRPFRARRGVAADALTG
ncbi:Ty1/Copia family ribonuclease HI [Sporobolomyces salmoneus]|uniref:Ty1/Copia family ribonuclease HI n=1 Tax=Sporobolomyces salmoneus TaxID=183962 RepID=UPI00316C33E2